MFITINLEQNKNRKIVNYFVNDILVILFYVIGGNRADVTPDGKRQLYTLDSFIHKVELAEINKIVLEPAVFEFYYIKVEITPQPKYHADRHDTLATLLAV